MRIPRTIPWFIKVRGVIKIPACLYRSLRGAGVTATALQKAQLTPTEVILPLPKKGNQPESPP